MPLYVYPLTFSLMLVLGAVFFVARAVFSDSAHETNASLWHIMRLFVLAVLCFVAACVAMLNP